MRNQPFRFFHILPLVLIFFISSCGVNDADTSLDIRPIDFSEFDADFSQLTGSWDWQYTASFGDDNAEPFVQTPLSTGNDRSIFFPGNGQMEFYLNGDLDRQETANEYLQNRIWGVRGDSLAISEAHLGGPEVLYIRE